MGFFLPVPPALGGATEKIWYRLAREFAARGHDVTIVSRRWQDWAHRENEGRLTHFRLPGANHHRRLAVNLLLDFLWCLRVWRQLPAADITVSHPIALPALLGRFRRQAGKLVVVSGRSPRGQYRWYGHADAIVATSSAVSRRIVTENSALAPRILIRGNPIDCGVFAAPRQPPESLITIGFVGRLHRDKGLELLAGAIERLAGTPARGRFRVLLCGPATIREGGSGPEFLRQIEHRLQSAVGAAQVEILAPEYAADALARVYARIDVFCYPSIDPGETFGVAVAEAMAAGCATVVSALPCFQDFVRPGANAVVFDHRDPAPVDRLGEALGSLITNDPLRRSLSVQGTRDVQRYDYATFADTLLQDFEQLRIRGAGTELSPSPAAASESTSERIT